MYEIKIASSLDEQITVQKAMRNVWVGGAKVHTVWGIWDNGVCIGGACISDELMSHYAMGFTCKPSMKLGLTLFKITHEALKIKKVLFSTVDIDNIKSRKGTMQLGFVPVRTEGNQVKFQLNTLSEKMMKRWGKYV
jgi:hypothetical protein